MAHLPPAGKRALTDYKLSFLPTMSEIPNPCYPKEKTARKPEKPALFTWEDLPPLKSRDEDWAVRPIPRYPTNFGCDDKQKRPFCLGLPTYLGVPLEDVKACCLPVEQDPRILPYGLPPETYDVRVRANWFDHWKEEHYRYIGSMQLWEKRYGNKYFYNAPKARPTKPSWQCPCRCQCHSC